MYVETIITGTTYTSLALGYGDVTKFQIGVMQNTVNKLKVSLANFTSVKQTAMHVYRPTNYKQAYYDLFGRSLDRKVTQKCMNFSMYQISQK